MTDNRFTFVNIDELDSEHIAAPQYSYWKSVFKKFFSSKVTITFLVIAVLMLLLAIIQPMISGYDPIAHVNINNHSMKFVKPNFQEWFGTDAYGDSLFDLVWLGARTSMMIAFTATFITVTLGVIVGAFWGYSKKLDKVMLELYNIIANVPFTLLVFVLMYILGRGTTQMIFSLSVTSWLTTAYFIRVQVMIIRDREYNLASRCLGTSTWSIVKNNILPFLISVIVTTISRDIPMFISFEVFLSYLGIGVGEKTASIGKIIAENVVYLASTPHVFWIPVCVLAIITISLYVVGQNLADASDPRTHI